MQLRVTTAMVSYALATFGLLLVAALVLRHSPFGMGTGSLRLQVSAPTDWRRLADEQVDHAPSPFPPSALRAGGEDAADQKAGNAAHEDGAIKYPDYVPDDYWQGEASAEALSEHEDGAPDDYWGGFQVDRLASSPEVPLRHPIKSDYVPDDYWWQDEVSITRTARGGEDSLDSDSESGQTGQDSTIDTHEQEDLAPLGEHEGKESLRQHLVRNDEGHGADEEGIDEDLHADQGYDDYYWEDLKSKAMTTRAGSRVNEPTHSDYVPDDYWWQNEASITGPAPQGTGEGSLKAEEPGVLARSQTAASPSGLPSRHHLYEDGVPDDYWGENEAFTKRTALNANGEDGGSDEEVQAAAEDEADGQEGAVTEGDAYSNGQRRP